MTAPRAYLDWNATAPLRPEAHEAMLAAMDAAGNPSSVHAEGRAAKAIVEKARGQVAALIGCEPGEVVFTSGATEAAATVLRQPTHVHDVVKASETEHDCIAHLKKSISCEVNSSGLPREGAYFPPMQGFVEHGLLMVFAAANGETGVMNPVEELCSSAQEHGADLLCDAAQAAGKVDCRDVTKGAAYRIVSAHKLGGPKGVGALIVRSGIEIQPLLHGGGQELGRRSGTENVAGIAGFGAAAEAALRDLEDGAWERVENLRNILESALADAAPDLHVIGKDAPRLPNTSCFAVRGWKGETQVMQMDLAGFAVSAGSACSSGKVGPSRVLMAMGHDEEMAASAIRVSLGPTTTEAEVGAFAEAWTEHYRRRQSRAA